MADLEEFFQRLPTFGEANPFETKIDQSQKGKKNNQKTTGFTCHIFYPLTLPHGIAFRKKTSTTAVFLFVLKMVAALFGQPLVLLKYPVRLGVFWYLSKPSKRSFGSRNRNNPRRSWPFG